MASIYVQFVVDDVDIEIKLHRCKHLLRRPSQYRFSVDWTLYEVPTPERTTDHYDDSPIQRNKQANRFVVPHITRSNLC